MVAFDTFYNAFLSKITEYDFIAMPEKDALATFEGYMKRAISMFSHTCHHDLISTIDEENSCFNIDIAPKDLIEIVNIVSEGMVVEWIKPYLYNQELLENALSTKDFSLYSPASLLQRVGDAYNRANKGYTQLMRNYSFNHGDLTELHI